MTERYTRRGFKPEKFVVLDDADAYADDVRHMQGRYLPTPEAIASVIVEFRERYKTLGEGARREVIEKRRTKHAGRRTKKATDE